MPVLALVVAEGPEVHAHGVVKAARLRGGVLGCSESEIHRTLEQLAEEGYLEEGQGEITASKRYVKVYRCTHDGLRALGAWVATPTPVPPIDVGELLARARIAPEVGARQVLRGLRDLPAGISAAKQRVRSEAYEASQRGQVDLVVQLESEWSLALLDAFASWLERATHSLEKIHKVEESPYTLPSKLEAEEWLERVRE